MSVFVSDLSTWTVAHDDAPGGAHTGTLDPASISHPQNMDGSPNPDFLVVTCPACGASSIHPVGGGAQPALVQQLFVQHAVADGCACDAELPGGLPEALVAGHIKQHCEAMDGEGRWVASA